MRKKAGWALSESDLGISKVKNVEFLSREIRLKKGLEIHIFAEAQESGIVVEIDFQNKDGESVLEIELENTLSLSQVMREGVTLDPIILQEIPPMQLFCMTVGVCLAKNATMTIEEDRHKTGENEVSICFDCRGYNNLHFMSESDAVMVFDFK